MYLSLKSGLAGVPTTKWVLQGPSSLWPRRRCCQQREARSHRIARRIDGVIIGVMMAEKSYTESLFRWNSHGKDCHCIRQNAN